MTLPAFVSRCLDRYQRDDAESVRIERPDTPEAEARLWEQAAEAHRLAAVDATRRAWSLRPAPRLEEGRGW